MQTSLSLHPQPLENTCNRIRSTISESIEQIYFSQLAKNRHKMHPFDCENNTHPRSFCEGVDESAYAIVCSRHTATYSQPFGRCGHRALARLSKSHRIGEGLRAESSLTTHARTHKHAHTHKHTREHNKHARVCRLAHGGRLDEGDASVTIISQRLHLCHRVLVHFWYTEHPARGCVAAAAAATCDTGIALHLMNARACRFVRECLRMPPC